MTKACLIGGLELLTSLNPAARIEEGAVEGPPIRCYTFQPIARLKVGDRSRVPVVGHQSGPVARPEALQELWRVDVNEDILRIHQSLLISGQREVKSSREDSHDGLTQLRNDENLLDNNVSLDDLIDWTIWNQTTTEESSSCQGLDDVLSWEGRTFHSIGGDQTATDIVRWDEAFTGTTSSRSVERCWSRVNSRSTPTEELPSTALSLSNLNSFSVCSMIGLDLDHSDSALASTQIAFNPQGTELLASSTTESSSPTASSTSPGSGLSKEQTTFSSPRNLPSTVPSRDTNVVALPLNVPAHSCQSCNRVFSSELLLHRHSRKHLRVTCDLPSCNAQTFTSEKDLKRHQASVHKLGSLFHCQCEKFFLRNDHLLRHARKCNVANHGASLPSQNPSKRQS